MKRIHIITLLLVFMIPGFSPDALADSLSCDNGIISTGDRSIDLIAKCGEPVLRESHQEEVSRKLRDDAKLTELITVDEWFYNFGPDRFTQTIILKNGIVTGFRGGDYGYVSLPAADSASSSGDYGYTGLPAAVTDTRTTGAKDPNRTASPTRECKQIVSVGDTKADVLARCGEPWSRESHTEEFEQKLYNGERKVFVTVEEWTYNFGPDRFVHLLTFRNSKLTDIKSGGYGYTIGDAE